MKKFSALLLAVVLLASACTGSFMLTKKVYQWNQEFDDPWVQEAVFLALCIVPVYGVAMGVDVLIVNSIEFWSGENPVASKDGDGEIKVIKAEGEETVMTHLPDGRIKVETEDNSFLLQRTAKGVVATDLGGKTLYRASTNEDGSVSVFDSAGKLIGTYQIGERLPFLY